MAAIDPVTERCMAVVKSFSFSKEEMESAPDQFKAVSQELINVMVEQILHAILEVTTLLPETAPADDLGEADVWHEGSKSFYRARLLKKLNPEDVFGNPL